MSNLYSFFQLFSKHGSLKSVKVVRDVVTGFSKRYGFVEFHSRHNCCQARRKEHKVILKGKEILVDYQCQHSLPGWIPRRLGRLMKTFLQLLPNNNL